MLKVTIIDDDAALSSFADNLFYRGYGVSRFSSARDALDSIEAIVRNDLIVLDIFMELPDPDMTGIYGGMTIYREIRSRNARVPILVYTALQDRDLVDIIKSDKCAKFVSKYYSPSMSEIHGNIISMLGAEPEKLPPTIFIVHGHNDAVKLDLKNYLQNTLHLPEPIILHEKPNVGRTIIEKFEDYAYISNLVFVLLTPDDHCSTPGNSNDVKRRARQNVIFELGFFLGNLGRESGRVILLHQGPLDIPNDLAGVAYIDISSGILAAGEEIRREINHVVEE